MNKLPTPSILERARKRFFQGGLLPDGMVPDPIANSWQRCRDLGMESDSRVRAEPMTAAELREVQERHALLCRLSRPEIEALHAEARATGSVVVLSAPDGLILDAVGDAGFLDRAAQVALKPGVVWGEAHTGTNAIGTALFERRPVEVRGNEHFFEQHGILSCSAAPIFDPQGRLAGVLDLTGEASVHHLHALGMVRMAVDQIEHRLFAHASEGREILRLHAEIDLLGTAREGLMLFEDGRLVAANRYALALFDLDWSALGQQRFRELFADAPPRGDNQAIVRSQDGRPLHVRAWSQRLAPVRSRIESQRDAASREFAKPEACFNSRTERELEQAVRLYQADIPLLVRGETGVGKEVFARELHRRSDRAQAAFVAINCAALPESLIEAELFGYEQGAFTGARRQGAVGLLRQAHGGTLFLDEIGDMPLSLQSRLLRVLQDRQVTALGGGRPVTVDFRLVCASNRDLETAIERHEFRSDLYYRIAQHVVSLPALREQQGLDALIGMLWLSMAQSEPRRLSDAALERLACYAWPGNYRQLVGVLRTLAVLCQGREQIDVDDLPPEVSAASAPVSADREPATVKAAPARESPARLDELTSVAIEQAVSACAGNISRAARQLGISRSTLYRRRGLSLD